MSIQKVFLSHTSELSDHPAGKSFVAAAQAAVQRANLMVTDMAHFRANSKSVDDYLRKAVGDADVFVGIIGFKYGSLVGENLPSFTEREYQYARERKLPCLIFILDEKMIVDLPAEQIRDLVFGVQQEKFRQRLMADVLVQKVATPLQLGSELHSSLVDLLREQGEAPPSLPWFMAPDLPDRHVERQALASRLMELLDPRTPRTIGLCGDQGSGKRTLAAYVCGEVRNRFPGGVLWATLGDRVVDSDQKLVDKINDLCETLTGERPAYQGLEAAGNHLGLLLEKEPRLLVVDDVRGPDVLVPFLRGRCTRLVTTRERAFLPYGTEVIAMDEMTEAEALELQRDGVEAEEVGELVPLSRITRESPRKVLLARKALRDRRDLGANVMLAAAHVEACLASDPELESPVPTLELLKDGRPQRLEGYLKLAVFAEDVPIPIATLSRYWETDERGAARLCRDLANGSLLDDSTGGDVRVRDVLRVSPARLAGYHRDLLRTHRAGLPPGDGGMKTAWWEMKHDEPYLWEHLEHHLAEAARDGGPEKAELAALRTSPRWRRAMLIRRGREDVLRGHAAPVCAVAISPDGSLVASADTGGLTLLRSYVDDQIRTELTGHDGRVTALAFSPDGSWLASAGADHTVRQWSTDGSCLATFGGHLDSVNGVAISPDCDWLASAGSDRTVRLWNVAGGYPRGVLYGHTTPVRALAVSPDGGRLVTAGDDWIGLWDTTSGVRLHRWAEGSGALTTVAISPDGEWLASAGQSGAVELWNLADGSPRATLTGHTGEVRAVAIAPDGSWLASAGTDTTIRVWDVSGASLRATLTGHTDEVNGLAVSLGGAWLATASSDGTVRLWLVPQEHLANSEFGPTEGYP